MGLPQFILIIFYAVGILITSNLHGEPKEGHYNIFESLISVSIVFILLIWGGYFS